MSAKGNGRLEVTAWVEHPKGMMKRAVVRVGDDLYTFEEFDERPAEKLGDGAMAGVVEREAKLAQREQRISEEAERVQGRKEEGEERFKELVALEKSLRDKDEQGRREHFLDGREYRIERLEDVSSKRRERLEAELTERLERLERESGERIARLEKEPEVLIAQAEALRTQAAADLKEASDLKAAAKQELASAELSIRRAVSRERTKAEEVHQKGRAVLKHLEDKLAEVGKKEALLDRRLEAMTNLMCGNVRDFMEDFK